MSHSLPPAIERLAERLNVETLPRGDTINDRYDRAALYVRSYLWVRTGVGVIGILLPIVLIIGEAFIRGSVSVRGSLSAYYHSPMQDVFVAALSIVAFLLIGYMSGQPKTLDFRLSLVSGLALFGVVFLPTGRSDLPDDAPLCGPHTRPQPVGCSLTESWWGEHRVAVLHGVCAAVFIASLAIICLAFAYRDDSKGRGRRRAALHLLCAGLIVLAVIEVFWGPGVFGLTPLYVGEVVSVWSFGVSWFVAGHGLELVLRQPLPPSREAPTEPPWAVPAPR